MDSSDRRIKKFLADCNVPCPTCGYNLRGCSSSSCPECGKALVFKRLVKQAGGPKFDDWPWVFLLVATCLLGGGGLFQWVDYFWPGEIVSTAVSSGKVKTIDWYPIYFKRTMMWATVAVIPIVVGRRFLVAIPRFIQWLLVIVAVVLVVLIYAGWYYVP